jgi:AraC-like DNA-binding protein/transposase
MSLINKYEHWRIRADTLQLEVQEKFRVEWMIYYEIEAERNAVKTCKHFGISKKTFYKWLNRFTRSRKDIKSLKNLSRRPHELRIWAISEVQEYRIIQLRKKYIHYGKKKLKVLYRKEFGEDISCWKIERVIRKHRLYLDKEKQSQIAGRINRTRFKSKRSFTKLERKKNLWFLFRMDTLIINWREGKWYMMTAVDHHSKFGYARMYKTKNSKVEKDFLNRLNHLIQQPIENMQKYNNNKEDVLRCFNIEFNKLELKKYFSWVNTPRHCTGIERFIETLEYEWLFDGNLDFDCDKLNKNLATWLLEYNFNRPHQNLNYLTPIEYIVKESIMSRYKKKVSPKQLVEKIVEYISQLEIDEIETLSVDKISMDLNVDRKKIWRYFKKEKKITLKAYLFRLKITHAAILLKNKPELTVKQIAEKIGYYSYSYFIHIFKKHYGITPGRYREIKKIKAETEDKVQKKIE